MAIFHLSVQVLKRSAGRSCVAAAAYRAAERLVDARLGTVHNYQQKKGVAHTEILAPKNAPAWVQDRERLWNKVERAEIRVDAQVCREVRLALPKELSETQQLKMLRRYVLEQFVARGMVADVAIHRDNPDNPHAHILLSMREISPEGFGKKNRDWNRKEVLEAFREEWEHACNRALHRSGHAARVDHRSHLARGILMLPGVKIGIQNLFAGKDQRSVIAERLRKHDAIVRLNGEVIRQDPALALREITRYESTFTRGAVGVWLNSRTADTEQFNACLSAIMSHPEVTQVGHTARGEEMFSTQEMLAEEKAMMDLANTLHQARTRGVPRDKDVQRVCEKMGLSEEQSRAVHHLVCDSGAVAVAEGFAGTGKSFMLRGAAKIWEKSGHRVMGMALSGKAAEGLQHGAKISDCRSIAAWEYAWSQGKNALQRGDVLVLDEAGMVGTRQMKRLLSRTHKAGAKVVLVGDSAQLQAVEAGSPFRAISRQLGGAALHDIRRQKAAWQLAASQDLAHGRTQSALDAYTRAGCVHAEPTQEAAVDRIKAAWVAHEQQGDGQSQVVLTYRRQDTLALNEAIRGARRAMGRLGQEHAVDTAHGRRGMAVGERLCFTKNNRGLGVKNGTLAVLEAIRGDEMVVRLEGDGARTVSFNYRDWQHFEWGYALTVHKSQGITVDRAHVLASRAFDRHAAYVAMTRHRERLDVYYGSDEFRNYQTLGSMLGRQRRKHLAMDFLAAERANEKLAAQIAPRKAVPKAPPAVSVTKAYLAASQAFAAAERLAKQKSTTPLEVFHTLEETAPARQLIREATQMRDWWRAQVEAYAQKKPLLAKLGLRKAPSVINPLDGQKVGIDDGLKTANVVLDTVVARLEDLRQNPMIWKKAKEQAWAHNQKIEEAKQQLPALQKSYEAAQLAFEKAPQAPQEHSLSRDQDRGLGR